MIKVDNLSKLYGSKAAVRNLDFSVGSGELFAFIGPNGSGKSTTIRMLSGLMQPSSGAVELFGEEMRMDRTDLKARMSFVPDTPELIGKLTGREYLDFVASAYRMEENEYIEMQETLLELFDMEGELDGLVEEYSHGMRQKLALIGALMHKPDILFLDEPTVGLDPKSNRNLKDYLIDYVRTGRTVFLTTHNLALAEEIATRILIIYQGEKKAEGSLEALREKSGLGGATLEDIFLQLTEARSDDQTDS